MKAILSLLALAAWSVAFGAEEPARPRIAVQEVNPWSHLNLNNDPDHFQFAIVTDRTGGHRPGIFEDAIGKLNLLQPEFVMSVGDLIEGYTDQQEVLDTQWREFQGFIGQLETPFFYVPGNHDISNPAMAAEWQRRFGASYYHFVYRDVLFLCLNSEDQQRAHISPEQIEYAARVLAENPRVRWTLVFLHEPLWNYQEDTGWAKIEELLKERRHTVFAGHFHTYLKQVRHEANYFVLATTGGGSGLRGPVFGEFDHVVWVTMTDQGPRVANLMLGVEVRVDGRPDPERSASRGEDDESMKAQVFVGLGPGPSPGQLVIYAQDRLQELGVRAICKPTAKGHNTEIAIPLSYFAERQGEDWQAFRLNIAVDDFDEPAGPLAQLWWQPDWRDLDNFAASGTFKKE